MEKTLLRLLSLELLERFSRFESLLIQTIDQIEPAQKSLAIGLLNQLQATKAKLIDHKPYLVTLLNDGAKAGSPEQLTQDFSFFAESYHQLQQLSCGLVRLMQNLFPAEGYLFLKDILPEALAAKVGQPTVVLEPEGFTSPLSSLGLEKQDVVVTPLSVLQANNPLGWLGLTQPFVKQLVQTHTGFSALRNSMKSPDELAQLDQVLTEATNLRLLGPAYYLYSVTEALLQQLLSGTQADVLATEPALFYGLNHFNCTPNTVVLFHEAVEKIKPASAAKTTSPELYAAIFQTVEKVIPDSLAFSQKHLERAQLLKERLAEGTLISSTSVFGLNDMNEALESLTKSSKTIYDVLGMAGELPHAPKEIVTAGWLHKIDRASVWLFSILQSPEAQENGQDPIVALSAILASHDHLLTKSIETSEVHRVLLCS